MFSPILILVALLNVTIDTQVLTRDERDFGKPGAMSVEQLLFNATFRRQVKS